MIAAITCMHALWPASMLATAEAAVYCSSLQHDPGWQHGLRQVTSAVSRHVASTCRCIWEYAAAAALTLPLLEAT